MYNTGFYPTYSTMAMQKAEIIKVNGEGGAMAYQMGPNSSALLLDETQPVVWLKTTDGAGYPSLTAYDITPHAKPEDQTAKINERLDNLETQFKSLIGELNK